MAIHYILFLLLLTTVTFGDIEKDSVEKALEFLYEAESLFQGAQDENVILNIGNTGSGKSTFVHFAASDYSKIISVKPKGQLNFQLIDGLDLDPTEISSTVSRTLVPEKVTDDDGFIWYDCPGFSDTRNTSVEILNAYFLKKIIDNASKVKFVLLVNYASVTPGYDRIDLDKLLTNTLNFIRNIEPYKAGVMIVVSKVPQVTVDGEELIKISEEDAIVSAGDFMKEYRDQLVANDKSKQKISLTDDLLSKNANGNYSRIGIFWRPSQPGPLKTIPKYIASRESVRNLILNTTDYVEVDTHDFGFALSDEAEMNIQKMSSYINGKILENLKDINDSIIKEINSNLNVLRGIHKVADYLTITSKIKDQFIDGIDNVSQPDLLLRLRDFIDKLNITVPIEHIRNIAKQQKNFDILQLVSKNAVTLTPKQWLEALTSSLTLLQGEEERNWRDFIVYLYNTLSDYNVQKNVTAYNVRDVNDWGTLGKPQGIFINRDNVEAFVGRQPGFSNLLKSANFNDKKLLQLNDVLNVTLRSKIDPSIVNDDTLFIKGEYVKLSDINLAELCAKCTYVKIFAINTMFFDAVITSNTTKQLSIIANKWVVIGKVTISLLGTNNDDKPEDPFKGTETFPQGRDSKPGQPGGNGGNFFGYANEIVDGQNLVINTSGGRGSQGQNGSQAFSEAASIPYVDTSGRLQDVDGRKLLQAAVDKLNSSHAEVEYDGSEDEYKEKMKRNKRWGFIDFSGEKTESYRFKVYPRFCCKKNGLPGIGGLGGYSGTSLIIRPKASSTDPTYVEHQGPRGINGTNAAPCITQVRIVTRNVYCDRVFVGQTGGGPGQIVCSSSEMGDGGLVPDNKCPAVSPPTECNENNITQQHSLDNITVGYPVTEFKSYLRENLKPSVRSDFIQKVYDSIDTNSDLSSHITIAELIDELNSYEVQFLHLHNQIEFLPFYKNFLKRVEEFSSERANATSSRDRRLLATLYTTALTKITAIENGENVNLIIDINDYFHVIKENIQKLETDGKVKVVNDLKGSFISELDAKIKEANKYINESINPTITNKLRRLEVELDETMAELKNKQNQTVKDIKKKQELLRRTALLAVFMSPLEMLSTTLGYGGPLCKVGLSVIDVGTKIGREFITDDVDTTVVPIPDGVSKISASLKTWRKERNTEKIQAMKDELEKLKKRFEDNTEVKDEAKITETIEELEKQLSDAKANEALNSDIVNEIKIKIDKALEQKSEELKQNITSIEKNKETVSKWVKRTQQTLTLIGEGFDYFKKVKADSDKLEKIAEAIDESKGNLEKLQKFEKVIYNDLVSAVATIHNTIEASRSSLNTKSVVALDVQQWKMKDALKATRKELVSALKDFSSESDVKDTLDELDQAFDMLIKIYDRVQSFQDQSKLVTFISALQTSSFTNIQIDDPKLQAQFDTLEVNIQSNIIIGQFLNVLNSFKQNAFPYADFYLDVYQLPPILATNKTSLTEVISETVSMVDSLRLRIRTLNGTVINKPDISIKSADFNSKMASTGAFYVWRNNEYKTDITDLLANKTVYLVANVRNGLDLNAVKFNRIGIEFHIENETLEAELKEKMLPLQISMVHSGRSSYRCGEQYYTISSAPQDIQYSFENSKDGPGPNVQNEVYRKLKNGNILLSPYSLWAIKFISGDPTVLLPYANLISIELYGSGTYINKGVAVCESNLGKYYDFDE